MSDPLSRGAPARGAMMLAPLVAVFALSLAGAKAGEWQQWPIASADMLRKQQDDKPAMAGADRVASVPSCLPEDLKVTLVRIQRKWGPVRVTSGYRPGARVRGTGRPSLHASCRAVDFRPAKGTYREVARWLRQNHRGGVGTYSGRSNHIHIDNRACELERCVRWHN
jgi:hypothetical protein